jgi:hypothetical protein
MLSQHPAVMDSGGHVKSRQRLIQQQEIGLEHQGTRQRDPLRLAPGQVGRTLCLQPGQSETCHPRSSGVDSLGSSDSPAPRPEGDVLENGETREKQIVLEYNADSSLLGRDECVGAGFVEHHVA